MPNIKTKEIEQLATVEKYLWEHLDWKENDEEEHILFLLWDVVEKLSKRTMDIRKKQKDYMNIKRKTDPKYDRRKK